MMGWCSSERRGWDDHGRSRGRWGVAAVLLGALGACAGTTPVPAPAQVVQPAEAAAEPQPDPFYRVDEPEGLIAVGRIRSLSEAFGLSHVPRALLEFSQRPDAKKEGASEVDWDGSFELAVVYDPEATVESETPSEFEEFESVPSEPDKGKVFVATSVPLKRYEPAAYEKLGYAPAARDTFQNGDCVISRARGAAPARLICGDGKEDVMRLYPYMAMGLPAQPLSPEPVYLQVRPGPLKGLWFDRRDEADAQLRDLSSSSGGLSDLLVSNGQAILRETEAWVRSLQSLEFSAGPAADGLEFRTRLHTRDPQPWLLQGYHQRVAQTNGPPGSFLALPGDLDGAGFSYGLAPEYADVLRGAVTELVDRLVAEVSPMVAKGGPGASFAPGLELARLFTDPCLYSGSWVWGRKSDAVRTATLTADEAVRHVLGETLVATPSAAQCGKLLNDMVGAIRALDAAQRKENPKSKSLAAYGFRSVAGPRALPRSRAISLVLPRSDLDELAREDEAIDPDSPATDGDAEGSQTEGSETEGAAAETEDESVAESTPVKRSRRVILPATKDLKVTLLTASLGDFDWFALGSDGKGLERRLLQVQKPTDGGLKARPELASLFEPGQLSANFQTLPEYTQQVGALFDVPESALLLLPKGWMGAPIISRASIERRDNGLDATWSVHLPPQLRELLHYLLELPAADIEAMLDSLDDEL